MKIGNERWRREGKCGEVRPRSRAIHHATESNVSNRILLKDENLSCSSATLSRFIDFLLALDFWGQRARSHQMQGMEHKNKNLTGLSTTHINDICIAKIANVCQWRSALTVCKRPLLQGHEGSLLDPNSCTFRSWTLFLPVASFS